MREAERMSRELARTVLGAHTWPDHYRPGQHDDFLSRAGCWCWLLRQERYGDPSDAEDPVGGSGVYRVFVQGGRCRVWAEDKWTAAVVIASLVSERPTEELLALATLLLASGWADVFELPPERASVRP